MLSCEVYTNYGSVSSWRGAGFCAIPLVAGGKIATAKGWQRANPADLWNDAPKDANIGIRLGGPMGSTVVDGDDSQTVLNIRASLDGLGARYVETMTAREGHCHFWLNTTGVPGGFSWGKLPRCLGTGELRAGPGAYVVAPSSVVGGRQYHFADTTQTPADIARLRCIKFSDLSQFLRADAVCATHFDSRADVERFTTRPHVARLPVQLVRRDLPASSYKLLSELHNASRGEPVGGYDSVSEAEYAVMLSAIRAGWTFAEVRALFSEWEPAHYADYKTEKARDRYLVTTWANALDSFCNTPTRLELAQVLQSIPSCWPGRGGALDCATYAALVTTGYTQNAREFYASLRDVCELSSASLYGVRHSLIRLQNAGLVDKSGHDVTGGASLWTLPPMHNTNTKDTYKYKRGVGEIDGNELWGVLGRSGGLVYSELSEFDAKLACDLVTVTGKHRNTVASALARLLRYGLAEKTPGGWVRGTRPLAEVVAEFDGAGRAAKRRERHDEERAAWRGRRRPGRGAARRVDTRPLCELSDVELSALTGTNSKLYGA